MANLKSTVMHGAAFIPRVGDRVEFWSDRQTEKGPSSGLVVAVDCARRTATIRHSDHPGEVFEWDKVSVDYCRMRASGETYWRLH